MTIRSFLQRFSRSLPVAAIGATALLVGVHLANADSGTPADSHAAMHGNMPGMHHSPGADQTFPFGEPAKPGDANRVVNIAMLDMSFEPVSIEIRRGETIRFVVTNRSAIDHDFTIGDIAAQTAHRAEMAKAMEMGGEMHHDDDPNAVMVKAGQTRELTWKFTQPGNLEFDCNIPGHYEAGMKGIIAVQGNAG